MAAILYLPLTELPFVDEGPTEHAVGNTGVTLDANGKFGNAARFTRSDATDRLQLADHTDWDFGTNNWTVHFWAYLHSHNNDDGIWGSVEFGTLNAGITMNMGQSGQGRILRVYLGGTGYVIVTTGQFLPLTTVTHLALVRDSTYLKLYLNGTLMTNGSWTHGGAGVNDTSDGLGLGQFYADVDAAPINISLSEFIIDDTALWTEDFTPPSSPYSAPEEVGFEISGVNLGNIIIGG